MSLSDSNSGFSYDSDGRESSSMSSFDLKVEYIKDLKGEYKNPIEDGHTSSQT